MATLAENLRRIRGKMSQVKLAKAAGVSQQLISQIENGENTTTKELPKLAKALGVDVAELDENFTPAATTPEEEDLLARYRNAPERRRVLVLDLLRELSPEDAAHEEKTSALRGKSA